MPPSRKKLSITIVGAGRVGTALACGLHRRGYRIVSVISRSLTSARTLARHVGCRLASTDLRDVSPDTNLLIVATPDQEVASTARRLAVAAPMAFRHAAVFHTSGVLTTDVLRPLARRGSLVFALHPISTFPHRIATRADLGRLNGLAFGFQGPRRAVWLAREITAAFKGELLILPKEEKILYHTACVFASNFVVALLEVALTLLKRNGTVQQRRALLRLAKAALEAAEKSGPESALTGPVIRGDAATVAAHLAALRRRNRGEDRLYREISRVALHIAQTRPSLSSSQLRHLHRLLA